MRINHRKFPAPFLVVVINHIKHKRKHTENNRKNLLKIKKGRKNQKSILSLSLLIKIH